jgi:hypothetical protein
MIQYLQRKTLGGLDQLTEKDALNPQQTMELRPRIRKDEPVEIWVNETEVELWQIVFYWQHYKTPFSY